MPYRRTCLLAIVWILAALQVNCAPRPPRATDSAAPAAGLRTWEVYEIELTAQKKLDRPYVDGLPDGGAAYVTVAFRHEGSQGGKGEYRVGGFWDGGRTWRVRFAPPLPGVWTYRSTSADPGLNGRIGRFRCASWSGEQKRANPTRRGFVRVCRTGRRRGRHFEYSDGTPMLYLGDTWWNWTKRAIPFGRFKTLVDDRAAKGFNVGQLFFPGSGWHGDSSLLDETCTKPDLSHIQHVEKMIRYANARGITVWVHGWWAERNMKDRTSTRNMRRWCRYMVHRLGAYNVIWVVAGEYNKFNYGGLGLEFWKGLGRLIDREDPYGRIIGVHPAPPTWKGGAEAPQWSTAEVLHNEPWLDYNQCQTGHGRWKNELIPLIVRSAYSRKPAKPIVVTEPWYEFVEGNPRAPDIRFGGWSAILSGAGGHSYGGGHVWRAHVPESPEPKDIWSLERQFKRNTLDYPGAKSLSFMARFLRGIDWWKLEPHPELVHDNPSRYCAAAPGREYVVYLRWGGSVKLDLRPSSADEEFEFKWIDLTDENVKRTGTIAGGAIRTIRPPEDFPRVRGHKDWVLHVSKK